MNLPELSIKRHVFAFMLSGVLMLVGLIGYQRVGVDQFPYIEFPIISVSTSIKGANPDNVDMSVTNVIESAVNSVPGIEHVMSTSSPGMSVVAITFSLEKNTDIAFNEVQAKINQALRRLPSGTDPPVVAKMDTGSSPIMWLALQGDRTSQQLNQYAANVIKKKLETISGVGEVRLGGRRDRTIRINLKPAALASRNLTTQDLMAAFNREHLQLPGGFLVSDQREFLLKLDMEFHHIDDLGKLVVAYRDGSAIRLADVAEIEDGLADNRQMARFNVAPAVGIGIVKVSGANTVAIADEVQRRLAKDIVPSLPPGMTLKVATNDAAYIMEMIGALKEHLIEGTLLAGLVVWLFLRSVRSTLIISVAIPVSLLGAIAVIYFAGYTLNSMTMLALLLLIGVVVDDAIVVLENIFRHREEIDPDPINAALNGSREVVFAVIAATLSLVSIFAPVIFMSGIIGMFFKSFAVVVTFGVLVSLFVSLTLTPMLCSRYLKVQKQHGKFYYRLEAAFTWLDNFYRKLLGWALQHRWKVVGFTVVAVFSSGFFFANVGKAFSPDEDQGRFMVLTKAPLGSSIEYTSGKLAEVERVLASHPEVLSNFSGIGIGSAGQVNQAFSYVRMTPRHERKVRQQELLAQLRIELAAIPGIRAFPAPVSMMQGQRGDPLQFVVTGPNLGEVARLSAELQRKLNKEVPGLGRVDTDLQLDLPQLSMHLDRAKAAVLGLSAQDVAMTLNVMTGGVNVAAYSDEPGDGERYDVRLKAAEGALTKPDDLKRIFLRARDGSMVRMDSVASFEQELGPAVVGRYDLKYSGIFYATPIMPLGDAANKVKEIGASMMPAGYQVKLIGQAEEFGKTVGYMIFAFSLAIVLLYMVLASQFNSFVQPFIIMVAQPLAIIGGVMSLWLIGHTLNIYSMIGLVLLIGLVAKNSILLIDLTNQRRVEGLAIDDALRNACPIRLRPVLMTSATIILALFPAALGLGAGAETNGPLAVAVIGGMISSTLLTLVVVPSVYSLVEGAIERRRAKRLAAESATAI
ncbi:Multidrug resistance protein MdtB [Ferriphaselus amnicola]|uniref:Multidrug resistance protein MdtB n=1 Tax=Ferriphaselus amnicola TaxID=1188319 RepID=A0A2Z6G9P4_9PROT|nr:efflux RND transporter permease subunit [Ferriphaselus amnicola]BBE50124.1 Multidrug resistance protein MdtB [Ferriphaselus amnicola]